MKLYEKIKQMSLEEISNLFGSNNGCPTEKVTQYCKVDDCKGCWRAYLEREVEE